MTPATLSRTGFFSRMRTTFSRALSRARTPAASAIAGPAQSLQRSYRSGEYSRLNLDFRAPRSTANAEIRQSLATMRAKGRALERDNDYARRILAAFEDNILGEHGVGLELGITEADGTSRDQAAERIIKRHWKLAGKARFWTPSGRISRRAAAGIILRSIVRDGDVLIHLVRNWAKSPYRFAVEIIEGDLLDEESNQVLANGHEIRLGVEYDTAGTVVAYWMRERHPDDILGSFSRKTLEVKRYDARDYIHPFRRERAGQSRGVPWLNSSIEGLNMIGGYNEAVLTYVRAQAAKMGFFEKENGAPNYEGDKKTSEGEFVFEAAPGVIPQLPEGVKFKAWDAEAAPDYAAKLKGFLRQVASGVNLSYATVSNDLESVNFSSIRFGEGEERDTFRVMQQWWISEVEEPIFEAWLESALLAGALRPESGGRPLPFEKFDKFNAPSWQPRTWDYVDPKVDVDADIAAINHNLTSRDRVIRARHGIDPAEMDREIQTSNERAKKAGHIIGTVSGQYVDADGSPIIDKMRAKEIDAKVAALKAGAKPVGTAGATGAKQPGEE